MTSRIERAIAQGLEKGYQRQFGATPDQLAPGADQ
jgi:hypothetical protein